MNRKNVLGLVGIISIACLIHACSPKTTGNVINDASPATYSQTISILLRQNCVSCHSGPKPAAKIDLTTYASVKAIAEKGEISERIHDSDNPMPPNGLMSETYRNLFDKWIADGYPN